MSDIKRYGVWDKPPREDLVTYADHEAAIALRTRVCAEAFEDELARTEERVLADAKARIEGLKRVVNTGPSTPGHDEADCSYNEAINDCLAALTQPQTEIEGKPDGTWYDIPDGGGAATAAGVADALTLTPGEARNLVDAAMGDEHDPQLLDSTVKRIGDEADRQLAEPTPYAKAFRERVCPVPEFPGIKNRQEDQA